MAYIMTIIQGGIECQNPTTELEIIKQKRSGLQRLVKLTSTLTRLHQGLQSVIFMGKPSNQIPSKIFDKFSSLSEQLEQHPTKTLQNTLSKTDIRIQQNIKHVLEISQKSDASISQQLSHGGSSQLEKLEENIHEYVGDFKKKAQTSIALRLTLKARDVMMAAFKLPVPQSFIEQQINDLDLRETNCREKIKQDLNSLQSDISNLMNNDDCSDEVKIQLDAIAEQLKGNQAHFALGKDIDEMPILYESIELSAPQQDDDHEVDQDDKPTDNIKDEKPSIEVIKIKRSFFSRLKEWLTSPANKKWADIKHYESPPNP